MALVRGLARRPHRRPARLKGLACGLAAAFLTSGCWLFGGDVVISLSEAQVQTALDLRFPVARTYLGRVSLAYHDPEVQLEEGSDRIGIGMSVTLSLDTDSTRAYSGRAHIVAGVGYDADSTVVVLHDAVLDSLSLGELNVAYVERASELARSLAMDRLDLIPIYDLKKEGLARGAARLVLADVTVEDGQLVITLGRPR